MLLEGTKVFVVPGFNPEEAERFPKNPFSLLSFPYVRPALL
jgi:hypothetical protein